MHLGIYVNTNVRKDDISRHEKIKNVSRNHARVAQICELQHSPGQVRRKGSLGGRGTPLPYWRTLVLTSGYKEKELYSKHTHICDMHTYILMHCATMHRHLHSFRHTAALIGSRRCLPLTTRITFAN